MSPVITCQSLSKSYAGRTLFDQINLSIEDDEKVALIGPNGSGKSTLLKIIAGLVEPDEGNIVRRRDLKVAYLPQYHNFDRESSVRAVVLASLLAHEGVTEGGDSDIYGARVEAILTRMGFEDLTVAVSTLSGGWIKRLALCVELVKEPDFLLLDEPTNHLDLTGVIWLEEFLRNAGFSFVLVSHDRTFLENIATRVIELNPFYKNGYLSAKGQYSDYLTAKEEYAVAQAHEEKALASQMRRERAWLMRGARARQSKSSHRIKEAGKLEEELSEVKFRNSQKLAAALDFTSSNRRTKELLVGKGLSKSFSSGGPLFEDLDIILAPGLKLGLTGTNGSGKSTLLKIMAGTLAPDKGTVKRADGLKVVWFDQMREALDQTLTLKQALCPLGDTVTFRGRSIHVASWAKRFLFRTEQLPMQVSYLSGGEQSRIFIARLMMQEADLLILDEPTNDLDIPSLEVLEQSLDDFEGAIVLVTHDRFMLDRVSTHILALENGKHGYFADYWQWQDNRESFRVSPSAPRVPKQKERVEVASSESIRKLSNNEKRELAQMEGKIEKAEERVAFLKKSMEDPQVARNHVKLAEMMGDVEAAQNEVDKLYARFGELDARNLS